MNLDVLADLRRDVTIRVLTGRGRAYSQIKDYPSAIADFSEVLEVDSRNVYVLRGRGYAHEMIGERDKAIADYRRVLEIEPNDRWTNDRLLKVN